MNAKFMKLLADKKPEKMKDIDLKAKKNALQGLFSELDDVMKDKLMSKDVKKVSVMSDSKEGLEQGLEKAKEIVEAKPEMIAPESEEMEEEQEISEDMPMSEEEIDAKIQALMEKKKSLQAKVQE